MQDKKNTAQATLKVEQWPIDRLIPYARNPRKNDAVVDKMVGAIKEFGFRIPIVARSDGSIVDGHLRLKAAKKLGMTEVPVALADELTDAQVKAFRLLANQSANWAEWDIELLADELHNLSENAYQLNLTGFTPIEIEDVLNFSNINFSGENSPGIVAGGFGENETRVKLVLGAEAIIPLEAAITKTGVQNRAEAVKIICEAYLEKR